MAKTRRLLFVCVENAGRSQMAEAFARLYGDGSIEAYSAGSRPSGKVSEKAIAAMRELGCDLSQHRSKSLADVPQIEYDAVVGMGCGDACPTVKARRREDWDIPDPKTMSGDELRTVRDLIAGKVKVLLEDLA
jgi:protein-tyrosine-phosphatase